MKTLNQKIFNKTAKFLISLLIICSMIIGTVVGFEHFSGITAAYAANILNPNVAEEVQETQVEMFEYHSDGISIVTTDKDEFILQLQRALSTEVESKYSLETKYQTTVKSKNSAQLEDLKLFNEFDYVFNGPESDFTLDDIKMVKSIATEEQVDVHVWLALVQLESNFDSTKKSRLSSAAGWGQVLDMTAQSVYENDLKYGVYDHSMAINKSINAQISIRYLKRLIDRYGVHRGLVYYNGGELGERYYHIIAKYYQQNTGKSLYDLG